MFGALTGGALVAWATALVRIRQRPARLLRTNVSGELVPAVLGDGIALALVVGAVAAFFWDARRAGSAGVMVAVGFWAAGKADDLRGNEPARGFAGHLRAAARGRVTGGLIKILVGGATGLAAAALLVDGQLAIVLCGAASALAANLLNLFDRAPGRAAKVWLVAAVPALIVSPNAWAVIVLCGVGAVIGVLVLDLRAAGMLGDAGANPLGAVLGLGAAAGAGRMGQGAIVLVLLAANLASERWSFSTIIERTPWLNAFDKLGRN
jgi:UDP-GlcNAc:undecaprenyl-phosphate GlcNAc-1-phosphate transferase